MKNNVRRRIGLASLLAAGWLVASCASAPAPSETWSASRSSDPITGVSRCIVAAVDRIGDSRMTRAGYFYPIVENNSEVGLLVGVSSGGRFQIPVGNILWRVDDHPHRELRSADNPISSAMGPPPPGIEALPPEAARIMLTAMAPATVASGERARELLDEMLAGRTLIFRATTASAGYGLPNEREGRVGQVTNQGLAPIPLDNSFRAALAQCGIGNSGN